jgi:hypothetical protein
VPAVVGAAPPAVAVRATRSISTGRVCGVTRRSVKNRTLSGGWLADVLPNQPRLGTEYMSGAGATGGLDLIEPSGKMMSIL